MPLSQIGEDLVARDTHLTPPRTSKKQIQVLANVIKTEREQHRQLSGDAEPIGVLLPGHSQDLVWEGEVTGLAPVSGGDIQLAGASPGEAAEVALQSLRGVSNPGDHLSVGRHRRPQVTTNGSGIHLSELPGSVPVLLI